MIFRRHLPKFREVHSINNDKFRNVACMWGISTKHRILNLNFFEMGIWPRLLHHDDAHGHLLKTFKFSIVITTQASPRIDTKINQRKNHELLWVHIKVAS
jgi:hypothetical protein